MNNIENSYDSYDVLLEKIGKGDINEGKRIVQCRIEQISMEINAFLNHHELNTVSYVNVMALTHAIMDYFSDIQRLKEYQEIDHVNEFKIKAYETFWLLKRKPIQINKQIDDDKQLFVNEQFLLSRLHSFMLGEKINEPINGDELKGMTNFLDSLLYYLKFRRCDAQSIELMLLAFNAGQIIK